MKHGKSNRYSVTGTLGILFWSLIVPSVILQLNDNSAYAQAGIRAQGRDVDQTRRGQGQDLGQYLRDINHKQEMRKFIRSISRFTRKLDRNFIVMTQDGLELLVKANATETASTSPSRTYMKAIDGVLINGLNFRPPAAGEDDIKTAPEIRKQMLLLAQMAKSRGLKIWVADFAPNEQIAKEVATLNKINGFIPFAANNSDNIFDKIPSFPTRPINENPKNVTGLKVANNFLYLTDSSGYDRQEDFVFALNGTNFDAVITDVFHRGRRPFTKRSVQGLKFKKIGAKRLVLARMNIGHAESFRYYWKPGWREGKPPYISSPTATDPDKFYVQYWYKAWQDTITGKPNSYVYGIFKQGFDGVLIDGIDAYQYFEAGQ